MPRFVQKVKERSITRGTLALKLNAISQTGV